MDDDPLNANSSMSKPLSVCKRYGHTVMSDGELQHTIERSRALMTERERELITADEYDSVNYQAVSRVRKRIETELLTDVSVLANNHPELLAELEAVVCDE